MYSLMQQGWLPEVHIAPRLSRIRNLGHTGINMSPELYEREGLGKAPFSQGTDVDASQIDLPPEVWGELPSKRPPFHPLQLRG